MWVILCASVWLVFSNHGSADTEVSDYPIAYSNAQCQSPKLASKEELAFYQSSDFHQELIPSLSEVVDSKSLKKYTDHEAMRDSGNSNEKSEEKKEEKIADKQVCEETRSSDTRCTYWWTHPYPHVYKLNQKCEPLKTVKEISK